MVKRCLAIFIAEMPQLRENQFLKAYLRGHWERGGTSLLGRCPDPETGNPWPVRARASPLEPRRLEAPPPRGLSPGPWTLCRYWTTIPCSCGQVHWLEMASSVRRWISTNSVTSILLYHGY